MIPIRTSSQLRAIAEALDLRFTWRHPVHHDITIEIGGRIFDNAGY